MSAVPYTPGGMEGPWFGGRGIDQDRLNIARCLLTKNEVSVAAILSPHSSRD